MAKKRDTTQVKSNVSFPITVAPVDTSNKTLDEWKSAREAAVNIFSPMYKPLHDLLENIALDTHIESVVPKRVLAITNTSWTFAKDGEPVEEVDTLTDLYFFEQLLKHIIDSKFYGHSLIEIDLSNRESPTCELVPRQHVIPDFKVVLENPQLTTSGIPYDIPPYLGTVLEVGERKDLGLLYKAAPYVLLKRGDISDWATFCEIFGMPLRIGKYDPNTPGNQQQLSDALKNMGAASWAVIPQGAELEVVSDGGKTGNDTYERFAQFCNSEISKCIVKQTLTTELNTKGGSRALGDVHQDSEDDVKRADKRFVERILNERFIPILISQGFTIPKGAKFKAVEEEENIPINIRLDMDLKIHTQVAPLPLDYFAEEYSLEFDMEELANRQAQQAQIQEQANKNPDSDTKPPKDKQKPIKNNYPFAPTVAEQPAWKKFFANFFD